MFLADQLDNPNIAIFSSLKHYLVNVELVKKKKNTVEIKTKTTMRYHLTPGRMAMMQKSVTSDAV